MSLRIPEKSVAGAGTYRYEKYSQSAARSTVASMPGNVSMALISEANNNSPLRWYRKSGFLPYRSRAMNKRSRFPSQIANANMPRNRETHSGPHSSYA